jgi:hypothetical protein
VGLLSSNYIKNLKSEGSQVKRFAFGMAP